MGGWTWPFCECGHERPMLHMHKGLPPRVSRFLLACLLLREPSVVALSLPGSCQILRAIGVPNCKTMQDAVFRQLLTGRSDAVSRPCDKRSRRGISAFARLQRLVRRAVYYRFRRACRPVNNRAGQSHVAMHARAVPLRTCKKLRIFRCGVFDLRQTAGPLRVW